MGGQQLVVCSPVSVCGQVCLERKRDSVGRSWGCPLSDVSGSSRLHHGPPEDTAEPGGQAGGTSGKTRVRSGKTLHGVRSKGKKKVRETALRIPRWEQKKRRANPSTRAEKTMLEQIVGPAEETTVKQGSVRRKCGKHGYLFSPQCEKGEK